MALAKSSDEKGPRSFDSTLVKKASRSSFVAALEADDDDEPAARDDEEDGGMACPVPDLFRRFVGLLVGWLVGLLVRRIVPVLVFVVLVLRWCCFRSQRG